MTKIAKDRKYILTMTNKADNMTEDAEQPAGKFDPQEAKLMLGLSELQFRFAMARLKGMNQSHAAREAGYQGDDAQIRSSGSTAARSSKVIQFLAWAEREGAGISDSPCDTAELKRVLSKHIRAADKATSIRAAEALHRINQADAEREVEHDPKTTLKQIADLDIVLADRLAREHGLAFPLTPEEQKRLATAKAKLLLQLSNELSERANGCAERGAEAKQHTTVAAIDGAAGPKPEKMNGALKGAEA